MLIVYEIIFDYSHGSQWPNDPTQQQRSKHIIRKLDEFLVEVVTDQSFVDAIQQFCKNSSRGFFFMPHIS